MLHIGVLYTLASLRENSGKEAALHDIPVPIDDVEIGLQIHLQSDVLDVWQRAKVGSELFLGEVSEVVEGAAVVKLLELDVEFARAVEKVQK